MSIEMGTRYNSAGLRQCDCCGKSEFLRKASRWDFCSSCVKKSLYKTGSNRPPINVKKYTLINQCLFCSKFFPIGRHKKKKFCSKQCADSAAKGRSPTNKIWNNKTERQKHYYEKYKLNKTKWLGILIRNRLRKVLKTQLDRKKSKYSSLGEIETIIGCTLEFLKRHIEMQFEEGMSWENWKLNGWHIDHIYPISKFDLTKRDELLKANNYKNLRPMWANENIAKRDRVDRSLVEIIGKDILTLNCNGDIL